MFLNAAWTAATRTRTYPILCTAYLSGGHHIRVCAHVGRHSEEELYLGKQGDPWRLTAWLDVHHITCTGATSPPSLRPGRKARRRGVQGGILAALTPWVTGENWPASNFYDDFYQSFFKRETKWRKHCKHFPASGWERWGFSPGGRPRSAGLEAATHSHVLFLPALIGQRGEVCQHEKWFPPWQETCYTSSRLFGKNMFFPLCI